MSSESFPVFNKKPEAANQERLRDQVTSPHVEAVLDIFKKRHEGKTSVDIETIRDIFYTFFEEAVEHTQLYTSEKQGAAFPYTRIRTAELSKRIYAHYESLPAMGKAAGQEQKNKMEFVFGSFLDTSNGNQFTFFEEAMHQFVTQLPGALDAIAQSKEPENEDVYVLGSPTNELGTVSEQFSKRVKEGNSFEEFGALYAEFIAAELKKSDAAEKTNVYLYGISMGGSLATQTAEQLLAQGEVTQSHKSPDQPFMQVRVDTLPGASTSPVKKWQIPLGFLADGVFTMATNAYTRAAVLKQKEGAGAVNSLLAKRGIVPDMTPEQSKMKHEIMYGGSNIVSGTLKGESGVLNDLFKGVPIDPSLAVTEVRGKYDPLQYSAAFNAEAKAQKAEHSGSLGETLVSTSGNRRTFAINQAHTLVFFRDNELKRIEKAAESLEKLKHT